jgi:hypothetical protein
MAMNKLVSKFVVFSSVVLFGLSGLNGDTRICCEDTSRDGQRPLGLTDQVFSAAEKQMDEHDQTDQETFKFPNVFDALRFIF